MVESDGCPGRKSEDGFQVYNSVQRGSVNKRKGKKNEGEKKRKKKELERKKGRASGV